MGVSIAESAVDSGCEVYWVSAGRRPATRKRAEQAGLLEVSTIAQMCEVCSVIVSVCPPEFAPSVARDVVAAGFRGVFVDANAGAPRHKIDLGREIDSAGIRFVDGGIIGLPSRTPGETTLFLSGAAAHEAANCFTKGAIGAVVLGPEVGRASALKILFAAHNKGTIALQAMLYAAAEQYGVLRELEEQFVHRGFSLSKIETQILRAAPKAWRWVEEMHEISAALEAVGMPGDFHDGAAKVYERLREFKDREAFSLAEVTKTLGENRD
jgi:3-hydroxyisobutyrate dehydrogenase-like beta-hydroxyacid dehydrogenase